MNFLKRSNPRLQSISIWFYAVGLGAIAGVFTPLVWFLYFRAGEWLHEKLAGSEVTSLVYSIALPAIAALLVFALLYFFRGFRSADGFTYFISDLHFQDGRRKIRYSLLHGISSLCMNIGGAVVGMEAFCLEVLSALGSKIATWSKLSTNQVRTLAACGATASIAALLGQPMAAVLFVVELLYGWGSLSFAVGTYAVTAFVAASVSQSLTAPSGLFQALFGTDAGLSLALRAEPIDFSSPQIAIFAAISVSFVAAAYAIFSLWLHKKTDAELHAIFENKKSSDISPLAFAARLALWAVLTAFVLYTFPDVLGSGVPLLQDNLAQGMLLKVGILALLLRTLMGVLSYTVLGSMGLIFPTLILGGVMGALLAQSIQGLVHLPTGTLALLGMGAFFSASFGTPVAATALSFGYASGLMSDSALFLFTSLLANFSAHALTGLVMKDRLASLGLYRHGIRFQNGMCFNTLSSIQVKDAMVTYVSPISISASLGEAYKTLMESKQAKLPVTNQEGKLLGMLSLADFYGLEAWKRLGDAAQVQNLLGVEEIVRPALRSVFPEMNLEAALTQMQDEEMLPVIDKSENQRYAGILLKSDLVHLYNKEVVKKSFVSRGKSREFP